MSKSAQLKRKAAEYEQKRQYDRALASYTQAIDAAAGIPDELDIPLYNRVGDLHLRLGELDKAVTYYETAVDLYAEGGFFNNAIALCNKVLRHAPSRTVIYYKLGKISAKKGFNSDAKQNFLEYASRTEKAGDIAEAFRALKEFADLCPGQDDVRLMLAEQLARAGRNGEALEQLQTVYDAMVAEDRTAEANAALERIRAIDASFEPRVGGSRQQRKREGLVFIDVDYQTPPPDVTEVGAAGAISGSSGSSSAHPLTAEEFGHVELPPPADAHPSRTLAESPLNGLTALTDPAMPLGDHANSATADNDDASAFVSTSLSENHREDEERMDVQRLDIEHTSFDVISTLPPVADPAADLATSAWPDIADAESLGAITMEEVETDSLPSVLTEYVQGLSSDVGTAEGGLPSDLAILPMDAIDEEQKGADVSSDAKRTDDDFIDLNEWLLEGEEPRNPRMTADEEQREAHDAVQTDFSQMLKTFKQGVAANVDESDADSHYDLGVAYMEMGLYDEAISQFQKAMRADSSPESRLRAYESLGQSFIEQGNFQTAIESLRSALNEPALGDAKLVGVLYLLGYASENLSKWKDAEGYYRRVLAMDIYFRDIGERLRRAEHAISMEQ